MKYILLTLISLCFIGCSSGHSGHYYKTDRQYRLEEQIDDLYYENDEIQDEIYELEDRVMEREVNGNDALSYYDEYDEMDTDELEWEIESKQDQIYDNEMEIIDLEYELDMTYID